MSQAQQRSGSAFQLRPGVCAEPGRLLARRPRRTTASGRSSLNLRRSRIGVEIVVGAALVVVSAVSSPGNVVSLAVAAALGIGFEGMGRREDQPKRTRRSMLTDATHAIGNRLPVVVAVQAVIVGLAPLVAAATPDAVPAGFGRLPVWVAAAGLFVVTDLVSYAVHRCSHEYSWWWRLHSIHHSSRRIDWLATTRGHPLDLVLIFSIGTIPAIIVDAPAPFATVIVALYLYPFVCHANTSLRLGRLERVIVSPHFHHWHHAAEQQAINRNYGSVLAIWDRMFGSAVDVQDYPVEYGVEGIDDDRPSYLDHLVMPFQRPPTRS